MIVRFLMLLRMSRLLMSFVELLALQILGLLRIRVV